MQALQTRHFRFGDFEIDVVRRRLLKSGEAVPLNSKTFDLLLALVEHHSRVLSKDELLDLVWEGQFVEEGNLKVHISNLRKVFGERRGEHRFIVTVPGRGYSFVAELDADQDVVVETHSVSRIVVDEEIDNEPVPIEATDAIAVGDGRPARQVFTRRHGITLAAALLIIGVGGYVLFRTINARVAHVPFKQMSIKRLTSNGNVALAAISPDGKLFAYCTSEADRDTLWLGHVDGGEPVQIRPAANAVYLSLKFSPDGSSLYFTVSENFGNGSLYKMPVFGGAAEKIRDNFRSLTFSPDGKQFAFIDIDRSNSETILNITDSDGRSDRSIPLSDAIGQDWHAPAWSLDGSKIALAVSAQNDQNSIFVMNVADGSLTDLAKHVFRSVRSMTWLEGGLAAVGIDKNSAATQLWFISFPDGEVRRLTTDLNLYGIVTSANTSLMAIQGMNYSNIRVAPSNDLAAAKQITFGSPGQDDGWSGIAWTPDDKLVYSVDTTGGTDIFEMSADGKDRKQLIPTGGINNVPSISADGRYLVFQSNRSGNYAIWRANPDGSDMVQLTGSDIAGEPSISPDGKWIVYVTDADYSGQLWRISIDGGQPIRLTNKDAVWPQVSPDSRFVAAGLDLDGKIKLAVLPIDGGEPLKTFDLPRLANLRFGVHWTPDGKAINYRDWANGIWRQDLNGGEPEHLRGLPEEKLFSYGWSVDGKQFAYARGGTTNDVVLIEDLSGNGVNQ